MADTTVRNLKALRLGTGEFSFSPGATSLANARAKGFFDFGNITATGMKPSMEKVDHEGSYRGVRRVDKQVATKGDLKYSITCDEWDHEKLKLALMGTDGTDLTQSAVSVATATDVLAFATTAGVAGRWYDLLKGGVQIRELLTLTVSGKTEGTDFFVDYKVGRIRFAAAQSADVTPQYTCSAITSADAAALKAITPLSQLIISGYGRLAIFDDQHSNKLVYLHEGFSCQVSLDSASDSQGKDFDTMTLTVQVTDTVGTVYSAE